MTAPVDPVDPVDFTRTRAWLEDEVNNGLFTRGAQVAVHVDGALVFEAAVGDCGTGEPMTPIASCASTARSSR